MMLGMRQHVQEMAHLQLLSVGSLAGDCGVSHSSRVPKEKVAFSTLSSEVLLLLPTQGSRSSMSAMCASLHTPMA